MKSEKMTDIELLKAIYVKHEEILALKIYIGSLLIEAEKRKLL